MRRAAILTMLALAGCATHPEPKVVTVQVKVPVVQACPDMRLPAPVLPDTPEAVAKAPDIFALVQLLLAGRTLRDERLKEDDAAIAACSAPPH